ncbi:MAG: hypothetical protein V7K48_33135 [Nostoc sp.]|uniref:hypothetical protein n=1 Tax=Nostoc sp. TaxID=1180 RepID=UPI002FFC5681
MAEAIVAVIILDLKTHTKLTISDDYHHQLSVPEIAVLFSTLVGGSEILWILAQESANLI